ncbi:MAG TPA: AP2 domain-containing protein [Epulopiscium sp.]|nr:AP2 domain-containing protein [Candidatus Epulonipiscium sp.]
MAKKIDLAGQRFGRLIVIKETEERRGGDIIWQCQCDCGNIKGIRGYSLRRGDTKSCGCFRREKLKKYTDKYNFSTEQHKQEAGIRHNRDNNWKEDTMLCSLKERKMMSNNTTGVNGVSWCNTYRKYVANIRFQKKLIFLGRYNRLEDATEARKEAEEKYFHPILEKYGRLENE